MKMLADLAAKAGRKGDPMATPSIWLLHINIKWLLLLADSNRILVTSYYRVW